MAFLAGRGIGAICARNGLAHGRVCIIAPVSGVINIALPVLVDGVAQIKIKSDDISIATAVEQFLSKGSIEIARIAQQTLEGHLRAIMGAMTVEVIY